MDHRHRHLEACPDKYCLKSSNINLLTHSQMDYQICKTTDSIECPKNNHAREVCLKR